MNNIPMDKGMKILIYRSLSDLISKINVVCPVIRRINIIG